MGAAALGTAVAATMAIATLAQGTSSGVDDPRQVVIRTQAEWTSLWQQHAPDREIPAIDFRRHTVVAVFAGTRPSAGYDVSIESVAAEPDGVVVRYRLTAPPPGAMAAQILTAPFHIVSAPRFDGPARFERLDPDAGR